MSENTNLVGLLSQHSNKWVALSGDSTKVAGVGDKLSDALKQASLNNEPNPILTKVPKHYGTFIL